METNPTQQSGSHEDINRRKVQKGQGDGGSRDTNKSQELEWERERLVELFFGARFKKATLSEFKLTEKQSNDLFRWIENKRNTLLISSPPGLGKTHLCAAIFSYCYKKKFDFIRVYQERKFLAKIRESLEIYKGWDYIEVMANLVDDDLVILDDFGSCGFNEWRKEVFQAFLDLRYQNNKATIITTNLSREEIDKEFHGRFSSRLFASENSVLYLDGEDLRKKGPLLEFI